MIMSLLSVGSIIRGSRLTVRLKGSREDDCWEDDCWKDDCWEDDYWEDVFWEDDCWVMIVGQ